VKKGSVFRIRARVTVTNLGSIRVLEKCGFTTIARETYMNNRGETVEEFLMRRGW
jgi:RimJ/RimL family protein N-acetyltransferase